MSILKELEDKYYGVRFDLLYDGRKWFHTKDKKHKFSLQVRKLEQGTSVWDEYEGPSPLPKRVRLYWDKKQVGKEAYKNLKLSTKGLIPRIIDVRGRKVCLSKCWRSNPIEFMKSVQLALEKGTHINVDVDSNLVYIEIDGRLCWKDGRLFKTPCKAKN